MQMRFRSGFLYKNRGVDTRFPEAFVYQVGMERFKCVSRWDTIPNAALWRAQGRHEWLHTHVLTSNMNFLNTPLEHRYKQSIHRGVPDPQLNLLAQNERLMWEGTRKCFILFKSPHPQGYQGVWVHLDGQPLPIWWGAIPVVDQFNSVHVLEVG